MSLTSPNPLAPRSIKRLYIDIESSPNIVTTWRTGFKINIDYSNIIRERAIICIAWKWEHEKTVHAVQWDSKQDDKKLLAALVDAINEADEVIGHNLNRFDIPWIRTRLLFHGLPPLRADLRTVDTLTIARRQFYFNSNKLDYIAQLLGFGGKIKTTFGLWKRVVLDKDAAALKQMVTYCKRDVELLEKVWQKLSLAVKAKTHAGVLMGGEKWTCPRTGSTHVKISQRRVTASGTVVWQFKSLETGGYYRVSDAVKEEYSKWRENQR